MKNKLTLPLGHPDAALSDADKTNYLTAFAQALTLSGVQNFTPYTPQRFYNLDAGAPQAGNFSKIYALWDGVVSLESGDMVLVQIAPSTYKDLIGKYYGDLPMPAYARYGPIQDHSITAPKKCTSGDVLGKLKTGQAFSFQLLDGNGYFLDPLFYCKLLLDDQCWNIPSGATLPLLPTGGAPATLLIAGPTQLSGNAPYLVLENGTKGTTVLNPGNPLPATYFSFLSNTGFKISTEGNIANPTLTLTDVTDPMYKTQKNPPNFSPAGAGPWTIDLETSLKPFHKTYKKVDNGKKTPGKPLTYQIQAGTLVTQIEQDVKDIIRQEYRFHSPPFQSGSALDIPERKELEFNNKSSKHFTAANIQNSNYNSKEENWVLNAGQTLLVAEYIRFRYAENVDARKLTHPAEYTKVTSNDLSINSSWRNPERNEAAGGVINSNHQYGKALDLKSVHRGPNSPENPDNVGAFYSLMAAGRAFLERLVELNGASQCTKVEVLLEQLGSAFWIIRVNSSTLNIESVKGSAYPGAVPADTDEAIKKAAKTATHVHIGWKSATATPLILPDISETQPPVPVVPFKNIILIATEAPGVPAADQIAVNYAADSVKKYLEKKTPGIVTEIHEVSDAMAFLLHCNAFGGGNYKIKYFFSFSHAWDGGLVLKHYPSGFDFETIKDPLYLGIINALYGFPADTEYGEDDSGDAATPNRLTYGPDDETQIMPHQIRLSNLTTLPAAFKKNLQTTFSESAGIYLVGCNTANEDNGPKSSFCEAFSNVVGRTVRGAAYSSFFFSWDAADSEWDDITINRLSPAPTAPLILVPGKYGLTTLPAYLWNYLGSLPPDLPDIPESTNLLHIYNTMLTPCYPARSTSVQ